MCLNVLFYCFSFPLGHKEILERGTVATVDYINEILFVDLSLRLL